jgi:hypothetical protein
MAEFNLTNLRVLIWSSISVGLVITIFNYFFANVSNKGILLNLFFEKVTALFIVVLIVSYLKPYILNLNTIKKIMFLSISSALFIVLGEFIFASIKIDLFRLASFIIFYFVGINLVVFIANKLTKKW